MIPSVLATQLRRGIEDYLRTTFQISTPLFHRIVDDLLNEEKNVFQGPYLSVALPFKQSTMRRDFFSCLDMPFTPHVHQEKAFRRLSGPAAQSTIVATGTGSGKTECFLFPILEYCYKNRNMQGIKAIVIYPMNALATDQAKRFAGEIFRSDKLRSNVTVGLYIGQKSDGARKASKVMTPDWVVDDRETLRRMPPDILLTNYKMLDYMLVRARDAALWKISKPDTLKYIVVDEMHTFDGAQGTDLACLIRRLKHRLKTPEKHLCCIGTSATLGGTASTDKLQSYAAAVFAEEFHDGSVITEDRMTAGEFLGDSPIGHVDTTAPDKRSQLDPENYGTYKEFVCAQHELWFGEKIEDVVFHELSWRDNLRTKLKSHLFFQNLIRVLGGRVQSYTEILGQLRNLSRSQNEDDRYRVLILDSLLSLISEAKRPPERAQGDPLPFLDVRLQVWARELTRMICECSREPKLRFSDDLTDEQLEGCLPLVNCRDCGATGWLGILRSNDDEVRNNLQEIYRTWFSFDPKTALLFPYDDDGTRVLLHGHVQKLCGRCLHLMDAGDTVVCPWCSSKDIVRIFRPDTRRNRHGTVRSDHICPFCRGTNTLAILGARSASITSVAVSQIFASTYNDDKKLLAFSDSVQDASHRAGFFGARTFRFNMRGALQKFVEDGGAGRNLVEFVEGFTGYWQTKLRIEKYISTFAAPDMSWLEDYEHLAVHGKLPAGSNLVDLVNKRIGWEIWSEYGFNARIGRTLEKSGCSVAHVDQALFGECVSALLPVLQNEIGDLRKLKRENLEHLLFGIITNLKNQGGIYHNALGPYIESFGRVSRLGQRLKGSYIYMPWFGSNSRTPRFLTTKQQSRFDLLQSPDTVRTTWHQAWGEHNLLDYSVLIRSVMGDIYRIVLNTLVDKSILEKRTENGFDVWGIHPDAIKISKTVVLLRCNQCGHTLSAAGHEEAIASALPCMRIVCRGTYEKDKFPGDFYASLYRKGDIERIFAEEHTGLLKYEERDRIEKQFINPEGKPCAPNLLSCTPTLELGINIGEEQDKSCPNCGSLMWTDEGQKRTMVKLRQVFATSEDSRSRIGDDSEERDPVFYNRQLLVNFAEKDIAEAFRLDSEDLPFGFEFIKRAMLREINFGRAGTGGDTVTISGVEMDRSGFLVCRSCGKIQKEHHPIEHSYSCPAKNKESEEELTELLYLYREYTSEAIRILLPTTTFAKSDELLHSFIASLQLGLKQQFGGNVEHLQTCLHEEPIPDSTYRKRYLVLYDTVPGGTGYLQQLMISHEKMVEVLEKALRVMENCGCRHNPDKDGCYRCLYAYRNSFDMRSISRARAIELLSEIVKRRDKFVKIDMLKNIAVNSLFDSELEQRFIEAIRSSKRPDRSVMLKAELVNRKKGYFLKVREIPWYIEPQVTLGEKDGVSVPVSIDFVFWPGRESADTKPIAVFTDGFTFHKDRIGLDCAQRMAILESGKFDVWSFSWHDITKQTGAKDGWYEEYLPHRTTADEQTLMKYLEHFLGNEHDTDLETRKLHQMDSFAWFMNFLGNPKRKTWEKYAFVVGLLYKKPGPSMVSDESVAAFVARLPIQLTERLSVDQSANLVGFFSSTTDPQSGGHAEFLTSINKGAVNSSELEKLNFIIWLDDNTPSAPGFEIIWNGFLRVTNVMQFLQGGVYLSRSGQAKGLFSPLTFSRRKQGDSSTQGPVPDDTWKEVFDYASKDAIQILKEAKARKKPVPVVGYELTSESGEVIATAELAWKSTKVAIILDDEDNSVAVFLQHGWKTAMLSEPGACIALLETITE